MKVNPDKIYHFMAGFFIFVFVLMIFDKFNPGTIYATVWGYRIVSIIGAAKELVWDKYMKRGVPELHDFLFTIAGAVIADFITMWFRFF